MNDALTKERRDVIRYKANAASDSNLVPVARVTLLALLDALDDAENEIRNLNVGRLGWLDAQAAAVAEAEKMHADYVAHTKLTLEQGAAFYAEKQAAAILAEREACKAILKELYAVAIADTAGEALLAAAMRQIDARGDKPHG